MAAAVGATGNNYQHELWEDTEVLTDDEEDQHDTTRQQFQEGKDMQGIPWRDHKVTREAYRAKRLEEYTNYLNLPKVVEGAKDVLKAECTTVTKESDFFEFWRNSRSVKSTYVHFQLRNLLWATSKHDVFVTHDNCIRHWSTISRQSEKIMDLNGGPEGRHAPGLGCVQISTMCVKDSIAAAGGFNGELVVRNINHPGFICSKRISANENGITNGLEIYEAPSGGTCILSANNDCMVRGLDASTFGYTNVCSFPWAVNYTAVDPMSRKLACVVGDDPASVLLDLSSGKQVASMHGHLDFSFAAAWHPSGNMVATGNQDTTTRVWDVRYLRASLAVLKGQMASIRSLRFSSDGRFLAAVEPADFVHVYDTQSTFSRSQEIDFFGEVSGIAFSPDADKLFVAISDTNYSSLLEFNRRASSWSLW